MFIHAIALLGFLPKQDQTPKIVTRAAVHYVGVKATVPITGIKNFMQTNIPKIFTWIKDHNMKPNGAEFLRYTYIDMQKGLDLEVGVPVAKAVKGDGGIRAGVIPAGRYVSLTHLGDYGELMATNGALQNWAKSKHLTFKMQKGAKGDEFVSRLEFYKSGPWDQKDPAKWETEVLYMVK